MRKVKYTGVRPDPAMAAQPALPEVFWDMYILVQGCYLPLLHVPTWCILELRGADTPGSSRTCADEATDEDLFILDWIEELGVKFCGFRGELSFDIPRRWAAFRPEPPQDASLVAVDPLSVFSSGDRIATVEQPALASSEQPPVASSWTVPLLKDVLAALNLEHRGSSGTTRTLQRKGYDLFTAKLLGRDHVSLATCGFSGASGGWAEAIHLIPRNMGSLYMCALARKYASGSPWPEDPLRYSIDDAYNGLVAVFNAPPFGIFVTPGRWRREKVVYGGMGPFNSTQPHWGWITDAPRYTLHFLERDSFLQDKFFGGATFCETGKDYKLVDEETEGGYRLIDPGSYPPPFVCDVSYAAAVVAQFRHDGFEELLNALRMQARDLFGFTTDGDESEELGVDDGLDSESDAKKRDSPLLTHAGLHISDVEFCLSLIPRPAVDVSEMPGDYIPAFSRRGNSDDKNERERTPIPDESCGVEKGRLSKATLRARLGDARMPLRDTLSDPDSE